MRYQIFSKDSCPLLDIEYIGYAENTKVTRFGPGIRNQYIIHYVISGKGCFNGNMLASGQGFLITPGMLEEYHPDKNDPWEFLWIISTDEKMADLFSYYPYDKNTNIFNYSYTDKIKAVADKLTINANEVYSSFEMLEIFLDIFKNQINSNFSPNAESNSDIYIKAAVNYIRTNVSGSVTVKDLTDILGISQPYLYRIFKEKFGKSPKQYINDYRIEQAKILLQNSDITVTQVANSVGFCDVLSFSRFFSLKTGLSPQKYRQAFLVKI